MVLKQQPNNNSNLILGRNNNLVYYKNLKLAECYNNVMLKPNLHT